MIWRDFAACSESSPEIFEDIGRTPEAVAICARCPVRSECLTDALETERSDRPLLRAGIRGGLTPGQRYDIYQRSVAERKARDQTRRPNGLTRRDRLIRTARARTAAGLPPAAIAIELGISERTVARWKQNWRGLAETSPAAPATTLTSTERDAQ